MADFALTWDPADGTMDLCVDADSDDLLADPGLTTAVLLSLFTDRRAEDGEPVPGAVEDRRGWWADELLKDQGDRMGSRRWLLERAALRSGIEDREVAYCREGLAWLLEDQVAAAVEVSAELASQGLVTRIQVRRATGEDLEFRFSHVWEAIEAAG